MDQAPKFRASFAQISWETQAVNCVNIQRLLNLYLYYPTLLYALSPPCACYSAASRKRRQPSFVPPCIHGHLSLTPVLNAATTTKEGHALCCRRACLKVEGALGPLVLTVTVVGWRLSVLPNRTYSSDRVIFANFVSYISAQDGPKFRAHCAQPASAQISKNILRNSRSGQAVAALRSCVSQRGKRSVSPLSYVLREI